MPDFDLDTALVAELPARMECPYCQAYLVLKDDDDPYTSNSLHGEFTGRVVCSGECCTDVWHIRLKLAKVEDTDLHSLCSVRSYLRGGKKCPRCNAREVDDTGFPERENEDATVAVLRVTCPNSDASWWEVYTVTSLEGPVL